MLPLIFNNDLLFIDVHIVNHCSYVKIAASFLMIRNFQLSVSVSISVNIFTTICVRSLLLGTLPYIFLWGFPNNKLGIYDHRMSSCLQHIQ